MTRDELDALLQKDGGRILRFLRRMALQLADGDPHRRDDLVQQALLAALECQSEIPSPVAWLTRVLNYEATNWLRRKYIESVETNPKLQKIAVGATIADHHIKEVDYCDLVNSVLDRFRGTLSESLRRVLDAVRCCKTAEEIAKHLSMQRRSLDARMSELVRHAAANRVDENGMRIIVRQASNDSCGDQESRPPPSERPPTVLTVVWSRLWLFWMRVAFRRSYQQSNSRESSIMLEYDDDRRRALLEGVAKLAKAAKEMVDRMAKDVVKMDVEDSEEPVGRFVERSARAEYPRGKMIMVTAPTDRSIPLCVREGLILELREETYTVMVPTAQLLMEAKVELSGKKMSWKGCKPLAKTILLDVPTPATMVVPPPSDAWVWEHSRTLRMEWFLSACRMLFSHSGSSIRCSKTGSTHPMTASVVAMETTLCAVMSATTDVDEANKMLIFAAELPLLDYDDRARSPWNKASSRLDTRLTMAL